MVHHEKLTLEAREVTKLHYRDLTSSNDEFTSYAQSIKLISTASTTHLVNNEALDLYSEGATLSKFIHEGRPTTTKPTFVALPSLTSHSTFYECSRSILCKPQDSPHSPLTKVGVIISYSYAWKERSHYHRSRNPFALRLLRAKRRNNTTRIRPPQQRKLHQRSLESRLTRGFNFKSIGRILPEIQVSKRSLKIIPKFEFFIPSVTLTLIYLYKTLLQLQHEHPYQHSRNTNG